MTRVRLASGSVTIASVAVVLVGCGSSSSSSSSSEISNAAVAPSTATAGAKTFAAHGILIHFQYPEKLRALRLAPTKRVSGNAGQASHAAIGVGLYDLIIVTRFPKRPIAVTSSNIAKLKGAFDAVIGSAFERKLTSKVTSVAGLPALAYPAANVVGLPVNATSVVTLVFLGDDEYELNCQYTPGGQSAILAACAQMLHTLHQ